MITLNWNLKYYCSSKSALGILVLFISYFLYNWLNQTSPYNENKFLTNTISDNKKSGFSSSVWCVGSNNSDRFCVFKNLCYASDIEEFVFFHGPDTIHFGVPTDRFDPALAELSSVENHNAEFFHYTDLPSNVIDTEKISFLEIPVLLYNRFHPENLMHIFHDDLLPIYTTLSMICKDHYNKSKCNISVVFTDGNPWGPFSFLYKALFPESLIIQEIRGATMFCFREAHVGVNKQTVWYQYGFKVPQSSVDINQHTIASHLNNFKQYFKKTFTILPKKSNKYSCVVLTRKTSRLILNTEELLELVSNVAGCSVKILNLEEYTVLEIISFLLEANVVVGMHGSLLVLALFLHPNSILIELFPYAVNPSHYTPYKTLATIPGMAVIYESWQNIIAENTLAHPENAADKGGISHLSEHDQKQIMDRQEVPLHLCCGNPEWLFRIYQDTVVDLLSFRTRLEHALYRQNISKSVKNKTLNLLYSGKVRNASCHMVKETQELHVEWQMPWNLVYLKSSVVEYELWIQKVSSDDVKAYMLQNTRHVFSDVEDCIYYMWVRCIADDKRGPFINTVECRQST